MKYLTNETVQSWEEKQNLCEGPDAHAFVYMLCLRIVWVCVCGSESRLHIVCEF